MACSLFHNEVWLQYELENIQFIYYNVDVYRVSTLTIKVNNIDGFTNIRKSIRQYYPSISIQLYLRPISYQDTHNNY